MRAAVLLAVLLGCWAVVAESNSHRHRRDSPEAVIELAQVESNVGDQPAGGYHGAYHIKVVGLKYDVQVYYYIKPGTKQFYFKSTGSGVDIPWCGPADFELKDNGDGTSEIIPVGEDPHCGAKEEKAHPVKELRRVYDHANDKIVMSMKVYTVWPIGWRDIQADCPACSTEECVMPQLALK